MSSIYGVCMVFIPYLIFGERMFKVVVPAMIEHVNGLLTELRQPVGAHGLGGPWQESARGQK